mgnify:CR=1 FL=1
MTKLYRFNKNHLLLAIFVGAMMALPALPAWAAVKLQPDFYYSWINLGRTYLARGQIATGRDILDKVRATMPAACAGVRSEERFSRKAETESLSRMPSSA